MYRRLLVFMFCLLGGALAGGLAEFEWHFERGSLVGAIVGVLAWLGVDLYGASQLPVSYTHLDVYKRQPQHHRHGRTRGVGIAQSGFVERGQGQAQTKWLQLVGWAAAAPVYRAWCCYCLLYTSRCV